MFNQDPKWLIPTAFLTSDRVFKSVLDLHTGSKVSAVSDLTIEKACKDLQFYYGGRLRNDDIRYCFEYWKQEKNEKFDLFLSLECLSDNFLLWQGDRFEVKNDKLEDWLMLCSLVDPAWIISFSFKKLLESNIINIEDFIYIITKKQCPFSLPTGKPQKRYADNHVHYNGHGHSSFSMLNFSLNLKIGHTFSSTVWPRREEYTLFESEILLKENLPLYNSCYATLLLDLIYSKNVNSGISALKTLENLSALRYENSNFKAEVLSNAGTDNVAHSLLFHVFEKDYPAHNKWIIYCLALQMNNRDSQYNSYLSNYIRVCNISRNYLIVSGVGLGQFVSFFGSGYRRFVPQNIKKENHLFDHDENIFREFRVGPEYVNFKNDLEGQVKGKITNITTWFDFQKVKKNLHLVLHFQRGYQKNENYKDKILTNTRLTLKKYLESIQNYYTSTTLSDFIFNDTNEKESQLSEKFDLRKVIRGYDVAGNENDIPIEVFSPILRVLRSSKFPSLGSFARRLPKPFLTVHSGEDYSHLLSGLRRIDEAVEFCQLKEGDRIGHALALGVNATTWASRQKRIYVTAGEHLDNLVWCYYQSLSLAKFTSLHISIAHEISEKINYWSSEVYGESYTPNELYQAWILRRNWPDIELQVNDHINGLDWFPDYKEVTNGIKSNAYNIWRRYLNSGLNNINNYNKIISVSYVTNSEISSYNSIGFTDDIISKGELDLYEAIQDFMMEKYSKLGIAIEACPTSNIYVGRLEKYHEHPIFRWNPPNPDMLKNGGLFNKYGLRSGPVNVCINTDDSALMPTTIENEHRIIRNVAIHYFGIGSWMADLWIDQIRENGMNIFERNHLD